MKIGNGLMKWLLVNDESWEWQRKQADSEANVLLMIQWKWPILDNGSSSWSQWRRPVIIINIMKPSV